MSEETDRKEKKLEEKRKRGKENRNTDREKTHRDETCEYMYIDVHVHRGRRVDK